MEGRQNVPVCTVGLHLSVLTNVCNRGTICISDLDICLHVTSAAVISEERFSPVNL